jgi:hypothetical protein
MNMLRWTSIFVGAISLFSLLERFINFGVAPHFNALLSFYRGALYPLEDRLIAYMKLLLATYHVSVPQLPSDAVILYTLFALAIARFTYNTQDSLKKQFGSIPVAIIMVPLSLVWPVFLIGNILAQCISPKLGTSNILFGWDAELAKVIGVCLALFGANAYLLA